MSVLTSLNELCLIASRLFHSLLQAVSETALVMNSWNDVITLLASDMLYSLRSLTLRTGDPKLSA